MYTLEAMIIQAMSRSLKEVGVAQLVIATEAAIAEMEPRELLEGIQRLAKKIVQNLNALGQSAIQNEQLRKEVEVGLDWRKKRDKEIERYDQSSVELAMRALEGKISGIELNSGTSLTDKTLAQKLTEYWEDWIEPLLSPAARSEVDLRKLIGRPRLKLKTQITRDTNTEQYKMESPDQVLLQSSPTFKAAEENLNTTTPRNKVEPKFSKPQDFKRVQEFSVGDQQDTSAQEVKVGREPEQQLSKPQPESFVTRYGIDQVSEAPINFNLSQDTALPQIPARQPSPEASEEEEEQEQQEQQFEEEGPEQERSFQEMSANVRRSIQVQAEEVQSHQDVKSIQDVMRLSQKLVYGAVRKLRKHMMSRQIEDGSKKKKKKRGVPAKKFNDTLSQASVTTSVADYKNQMELQYQRKNLEYLVELHPSFSQSRLTSPTPDSLQNASFQEMHRRKGEQQNRPRPVASRNKLLVNPKKVKQALAESEFLRNKIQEVDSEAALSRQTTLTNLNRGGQSGRLRKVEFVQSEEVKGEEIPEFPEMEESSFQAQNVISQFINSPDLSKIRPDQGSFAHNIELMEPPLESEHGSEVVEHFISKTFLSEKDQEMLRYIDRELQGK